jgi:adenosylcobinamide-GDP ribazoletransferase
MSFLVALTFLTILPAPRKTALSGTDFGRSTAWFPLVGLLLGAMLLAVAALSRWLWSGLTVDILVVLAWMGLTGGLHMDGLADMADGVFGGGTRQERLAIMQDSRIGAFGVLALVAVVLLKVAFLGELADNLFTPALLVAPAVGRWAMVLAIHSFPAARSGGMGDLIKQHSGHRELLVATATALTAAGVGLGIAGLAVAALAAGMGLLLGRLLASRLGGLTGDVYGAICELVELATLILLGVLPSLGRIA